MSIHPLSGLEVGWLAYPEENGEDSIEWVQLLDLPLLSEINLESYPGILLNPLGYFIFGYASTWAGNCFAFSPAEGNDPPVYEIWHDSAQDEKGMEKAIRDRRGVTKISESFSSFFKNAVSESETS